jgi:hypothetical protein
LHPLLFRYLLRRATEAGERSIARLKAQDPTYNVGEAQMTDEQRKVLRRIRRELTASFDRARAKMGEPGHARDWFVPFLVDLLRAYRRLRRKVVNGRKIRGLVGPNPRARFSKLLAKCTNRDAKTRSRWAAAMANAIEEKITPDKLADWLTQRGGISGRAKP